MEQPPADSPASEDPAALSSEGNKPGSTSRKRKAPEEYSTNPNTMRVRARNAKLPPYQLEIERAKANDQKAVVSAWKFHTNNESFREAPEAQRKKTLDEVERKVLERRRRRGIDANTKIAELNKEYGYAEDAQTPPEDVDEGGAQGDAAVPATARPGYTAVATQPIAALMAQPRKNAQPRVTRSSAAGTSASASTQTVPAVENRNMQLEAKIDDLKRRYEAERDQNKEEQDRIKQEQDRNKQEIKGLKTQIRELQGYVENMVQQIAALQNTQMHAHPYTLAHPAAAASNVYTPHYPEPPAAHHAQRTFHHSAPHQHYGYVFERDVLGDDYDVDGQRPLWE
ncbi:hypothetical protein GGR55DRAFT_185230 [Xylaria sp. FL0064]|nr:hypothetical protein GGR55DRAFT_185230 [Xylaria sp. FL0064]